MTSNGAGSATQESQTPPMPTPPGSAAVIVDRLVKQYPKSRVAAVDNLSFSVERGEVFGLLGPNGAGKTDRKSVV